MIKLKKLIVLALLILVIVIQFKKTDCSIKISESENKINEHDHAKYITPQEFDKLTAYNFMGRLKQASLVSKDDINNFVF